jgi:AcrR family transcriptional regulator
MLDKRELILRCAARLFRVNGYAAVSMRNIASEAGMTTGSLYYYFRQKDEIVAEILDTGHRRVHSEVMRAISSLGPDASGSERIRAGIRSHLGALFEEDGFPAANVRIFAHVPKHVRDQVRTSRRAYERYWMTLLANAEISERVGSKELTMFLFGAANWTLDWYREGRDSLDEIAESLATVFFSSIANRQSSSRDVVPRIAKAGRRVA